MNAQILTDPQAWGKPWLSHSGSPAPCGNCNRIGIHDARCLNRSEHQLPEGTDLKMISCLPDLAKLAIIQCGLHSSAKLNTLVVESAFGQSWVHFEGIDDDKHTVNATCLSTEIISVQDSKQAGAHNVSSSAQEGNADPASPAEPDKKRQRTTVYTAKDFAGSFDKRGNYLPRTAAELNSAKNISTEKVKRYDCSLCGVPGFKDTRLLVKPTCGE